MPVSRYCATDFKANSIGSLYTLRNPDNWDIFYVGKTFNRQNRLTGHICSAKRHYGTPKCTEKEKYIVNIIDAGKLPVMGYLGDFPIRTQYDAWYFDYREV